MRLVSCLCNIILTALSTLAGDLKWGSSSRARFQPSPVSYIQYHKALSAVTDAHDSLSSLPATPHPVRFHHGPSHQQRWHHSQTEANACNWCKSETDGLSRPKEEAACFRDHMNAHAHIHPIVQFNTCTGRIWHKCHAEKHSSQVHLSFVLCEVWVDCVSVFFFFQFLLHYFSCFFFLLGLLWYKKKENKI